MVKKTRPPKKPTAKEVEAPRARFAKLAAREEAYKEAVHDLRAAEERYRFAQEAVGIGTWDWDVRSETIFWSPITQEIHGFAPGEFDGSFEKAASHLHPDDAMEVRERIAEAVASGKRFEGEYRVIWPDGTVHWLWAAGDCITDAEGKTIRVIGVNQDITARKNAEEALAASEGLLRDIVDTAFATTVLIDGGRVIYANKRVTEIFGYDAAEADGLPFTAFFPPDEGERVTQLTRTEDEYEGEHRGVKKDGTPIWLRVRARPLEYQGKQVRLVYLIDITSLRDALEAVRASEERYALAQRAADIGSWDWDIVTGDLYWSDRIEPIFGFAPGRFRKTYEAFLDCVHAGDREFVVSSVDAAVAGTADYAIQHRIVWPDGTVRWVSETGDVVRDEDGKPVHMYGVVQDVTAHKELELAREGLVAELAARNAEMERFTYTVSHDLKSPLITIKGFLGFMERALASGDVERVTEDLARVDKAATRMQELLEGVLMLSRAGRVVNPPRLVPLRGIVEDVLELSAGRLHERGVKVAVDGDWPDAWCDGQRVAEVLQNLVDNAVKFMGDQAEPRIEISSRPEDGRAIVCVRDNGVGIDGSYHDRVFRLFEQLDTQTEGTGLGLAIARRIIETQNGAMWVESEGAGRGSAFYFTLPLRGEPYDE